MSSHWDEVISRYPESATETYLAEAEAVIGDGASRFGGWLVLTNRAFYIGRQGLAGIGRPRRSSALSERMLKSRPARAPSPALTLTWCSWHNPCPSPPTFGMEWHSSRRFLERTTTPIAVQYPNSLMLQRTRPIAEEP